MWPTLLSQLIGLAPHVARLVPTPAERDLRAQAESREASQKAMEEMAAGVREGLEKISDAYAEIDQRLNEQGEALAKMASEVHAFRLANENFEARLAQVETQMSWLWFGLFVVLVLVVCTVAVGIVYYVHRVHHA